MPPPPPEGFQPPPLWGVRDHVAELFEGTGLELDYADADARFHFDSVDEMFEEYSTKFGPLVLLRAALEPEGRWQAAEDHLRALYEHTTYPDDGGVGFDGAYLVVLATKPGEPLGTSFDAAGVLAHPPPVAPMVVPARAAQEALPGWEPALPLALTVAFTLLLIWLAARIYERAVLRMGAR